MCSAAQHSHSSARYLHVCLETPQGGGALGQTKLLILRTNVPIQKYCLLSPSSSLVVRIVTFRHEQIHSNISARKVSTIYTSHVQHSDVLTVQSAQRTVCTSCSCILASVTRSSRQPVKIYRVTKRVSDDIVSDVFPSQTSRPPPCTDGCG